MKTKEIFVMTDQGGKILEVPHDYTEEQTRAAIEAVLGSDTEWFYFRDKTLKDEDKIKNFSPRIVPDTSGMRIEFDSFRRIVISIESSNSIKIQKVGFMTDALAIFPKADNTIIIC